MSFKKSGLVLNITIDLFEVKKKKRYHLLKVSQARRIIKWMDHLGSELEELLPTHLGLS